MGTQDERKEVGIGRCLSILIVYPNVHMLVARLPETGPFGLHDREHACKGKALLFFAFSHKMATESARAVRHP